MPLTAPEPLAANVPSREAARLKRCQWAGIGIGILATAGFLVGQALARPEWAQVAFLGMLGGCWIALPIGANWVVHAGVWRYGVLFLCLLGMIVGQTTREDRKWFPFSSWRMYTENKLRNEVTIFRCFVDLSNGERREVNLDRLMMRLNGTTRNLTFNLHRSLEKGEALQTAPRPAKEQAEIVRTIELSLQFVAEAYERRTGECVERVAIEKATVPVTFGKLEPEFRQTHWSWGRGDREQ